MSTFEIVEGQENVKVQEKAMKSGDQAGRLPLKKINLNSGKVHGSLVSSGSVVSSPNMFALERNFRELNPSSSPGETALPKDFGVENCSDTTLGADREVKKLPPYKGKAVGVKRSISADWHTVGSQKSQEAVGRHASTESGFCEEIMTGLRDKQFTSPNKGALTSAKLLCEGEGDETSRDSGIGKRVRLATPLVSHYPGAENEKPVEELGSMDDMKTGDRASLSHMLDDKVVTPHMLDDKVVTPTSKADLSSSSNEGSSPWQLPQVLLSLESSPDGEGKETDTEDDSIILHLVEEKIQTLQTTTQQSDEEGGSKLTSLFDQPFPKRSSVFGGPAKVSDPDTPFRLNRPTLSRIRSEPDLKLRGTKNNPFASVLSQIPDNSPKRATASSDYQYFKRPEPPMKAAHLQKTKRRKIMEAQCPESPMSRQLYESSSSTMGRKLLGSSLSAEERVAADELEKQQDQAKQLFRCKSMVEKSANFIQTNDDTTALIGDHTRPCSLPLIKGKNNDLNSITVDTMAAVLRGEYDSVIKSFTIVDCRYPYEFQGGHMRGAKSLYTKEDILNAFMMGEKPSENHVLFFHCEFSSERGPKMSRFLRNKDRDHHQDCYPNLFYPEMYIVECGYKEFYGKHKDLCEPQSYVPMLHKDFTSELRACKVKSKTWNGTVQVQRRARRLFGDT